MHGALTARALLVTAVVAVPAVIAPLQALVAALPAAWLLPAANQSQHLPGLAALSCAEAAAAAVGVAAVAAQPTELQQQRAARCFCPVLHRSAAAVVAQARLLPQALNPAVVRQVPLSQAGEPHLSPGESRRVAA
jgi:hypothetical protein